MKLSEIGGNVRVFGDSVNIDSNITRNLNAFGSNITIGENTRVGWDVLTVSISSARIQGKHLWLFKRLWTKDFLAGKIGKNADIKNFGQNQGLTIAKETVINGDLNYSAKIPANIADGANISDKQIIKKFKKKKNLFFHLGLESSLFYFINDFNWFSVNFLNA